MNSVRNSAGRQNRTPLDVSAGRQTGRNYPLPNPTRSQEIGPASLYIEDRKSGQETGLREVTCDRTPPRPAAAAIRRGTMLQSGDWVHSQSAGCLYCGACRAMNGVYWFALHGKEDDTPLLEAGAQS